MTPGLFLVLIFSSIIDGDGSAPEVEMFAKYPPTPSDSVPGTPRPRRKIRCKMCRCVYRDLMLDISVDIDAFFQAGTGCTRAHVGPRAVGTRYSSCWYTIRITETFQFDSKHSLVEQPGRAGRRWFVSQSLKKALSFRHLWPFRNTFNDFHPRKCHDS